MKTVRVSRIMGKRYAAALAAYWVRKYPNITMVAHLEDNGSYISADIDDKELAKNLKLESEYYCVGYTDALSGRPSKRCENPGYHQGCADSAFHMVEPISV